MYIIHEVSENILLVGLDYDVSHSCLKLHCLVTGYGLWNSPNKGINPRYMSIYVRVSTGARLIIWFRFIYILPKHTPLFLLACSLQSARNC